MALAVIVPAAAVAAEAFMPTPGLFETAVTGAVASTAEAGAVAFATNRSMARSAGSTVAMGALSFDGDSSGVATASMGDKSFVSADDSTPVSDSVVADVMTASIELVGLLLLVIVESALRTVGANIASSSAVEVSSSAGGGGEEGGGASLAAKSMASPPLGQKSQSRHLHQAQWNFLCFALQNDWHCAVFVSPFTEETHWLAPCSCAAVITLPPDANLAKPLLERFSCVLDPPSPLV